MIARRIDEAFARRTPRDGDRDLFSEFRGLLDTGEIRAAQPDPTAAHRLARGTRALQPGRTAGAAA